MKPRKSELRKKRRAVLKRRKVASLATVNDPGGHMTKRNTVVSGAERSEFVLLTDEWLRKTEVWRAPFITRGRNKVAGGFQRRLDERKVVGVLKSVQEGRNVPPIMIMRIGKKFVLTDGQHRLEARRRLSFPLYAQVCGGSLEDAAADFVDQAKASKVSLRHVLHVDPSDFARRIRRLAKKFTADPSQVYNLLTGVAGKKRARIREIEEAEWILAETILASWSTDKRWKLLKRTHGSSYSKPGTLMMVGSICKERPKAVKNILKTLKGMDFQTSKAFGRRYGTTAERQNDMRQYALNYLLRKG